MNILAGGIGVVFFLALTLLGIWTLLDNGWGPRRLASTAVAALHELLTKATAHRRRSQWRAAQRLAKVLAIRGRSALVQLNLRRKVAGVLDSRPKLRRAPALQARPAFRPLHDRHVAGTLEDLAGLYLSPPEHALVWSCGSSFSQERSATTAHRNALLGSTPLSDALCDLSSSVIGSCDLRQRPIEWLKFLRRVEQQTPRGRQLRVMCDNPATQDHPSVRKWLAGHPHVHLQFPAGSDSGLKMVKRFVDNVITEQLGVRAFQTVAELTAAITNHLAARLTNAEPFIWVRQPPALAATDRERPQVPRQSEPKR